MSTPSSAPLPGTTASLDPSMVLFKVFGQAVQAHLRRYRIRRIPADDLRQQAILLFLSDARKRPGYSRDTVLIDVARIFVQRAARSMLRGEFKSRTVAHDLSTIEANPTSAENMVREILAALRATLAPQVFRTFELVCIKGQSYADAGKATQVTGSVPDIIFVRNAVYQGRREARRLFRDWPNILHVIARYDREK